MRLYPVYRYVKTSRQLFSGYFVFPKELPEKKRVLAGASLLIGSDINEFSVYLSSSQQPFVYYGETIHPQLYTYANNKVYGISPVSHLHMFYWAESNLVAKLHKNKAEVYLHLATNTDEYYRAHLGTVENWEFNFAKSLPIALNLTTLLASVNLEFVAGWLFTSWLVARHLVFDSTTPHLFVEVVEPENDEPLTAYLGYFEEQRFHSQPSLVIAHCCPRRRIRC